MDSLSTQLAAIQRACAELERITPSSSPETYPSSIDAQLHIDDTITNLLSTTQTTIHRLRRTRNALAPISQLPQELLLEIFLTSRDRAALSRNDDHPKMPRMPGYAGSSPTKSARDGWIALTHVSHAWRALALTAPTLWSQLDGAASAAPSTLARAGPLVPLSVRSDLIAGGSVSALQRFLAAHLPRVHAISLRLRPAHLDALAAALAGPKPHLRALELRVELPMGARAAYVLPADVLENAPCLRSVALYGCTTALAAEEAGEAQPSSQYIPSDLAVPASATEVVAGCALRGLTNLTLAQSALAPRLTSPALSTLFAANPRLASLSLTNVLPLPTPKPADDPCPPSTTSGFALPTLQELHLDDMPEALTSFLGALHLPRDTRLSLASTTGLGALAPLLSTVSARLGCGMRAVRMAETPAGALRVEGWAGAVMHSAPRAVLELRTERKIAPLLVLRALAAEGPGVVLENVTLRRAMGVDDWLLLAGPLAGVRRLRVGGAGVDGLLEALELEAGAQRLMPVLERLVLEGAGEGHVQRVGKERRVEVMLE